MPRQRRLSDDQIAHVRWLWECDTSHKWSHRELAAFFGVSTGCIHNAIYYWVAPEIKARQPEDEKV